MRKNGDSRYDFLRNYGTVNEYEQVGKAYRLHRLINKVDLSIFSKKMFSQIFGLFSNSVFYVYIRKLS